MTATVVRELMTTHPVFISETATLQDAARLMKRINCGVLPVGSEYDLEGIITDRDIVIRALANGSDIFSKRVRDFMSRDVHICHENDLLRNAAELMHRHNVSRLIVKDYKGKVSGILSFGGILRRDPVQAELTEVVEHAVGWKNRHLPVPSQAAAR
ncbi:CBS domain-containing protein [Emcibacter sp.]|uniref:CBS domain-containing protein n=1 Tax=Emcibacter sp. TaxID=1979954 RepID=UPI002AA8CDCC|nr:CBS domain-containing protein [Emcibacter sp.]